MARNMHKQMWIDRSMAEKSCSINADGDQFISISFAAVAIAMEKAKS